MTNTERLIADYELSLSYGITVMRFEVGKHTANHPSVVAALRRRGYFVYGHKGHYRIEGFK